MKKVHFILLGFLVIVLTSFNHTMAQTVVTNTNATGVGSLKQAISDVTSGGTITFDASISNGIITLTSQISISKDITIDGEDNNITITGNNGIRFFYIGSGNVYFNNIILSGGNYSYGTAFYQGNGNLTIDNCTINGFQSSDSWRGGAIYINGGNFTANNCTFTNNQMNNGYGSALGYSASSGTFSLTNCTFENNSARFGGAVAHFNTSGNTITNCIFRNNIANTYGGALYATNNGGITFTNNIFENNTSENDGGAIYILQGSNTYIGCLFKGNSTNVSGSYNGGGAIRVDQGTHNFNNCTFTENLANSGIGGALFIKTPTTINNCTFIENSASNGGGIYRNSTLYINNTILADNTGSDYAGSQTNYVTNSLCKDGTLTLALFKTDPNLSSLGDFGGSTQTFKLLPESVCIDAADKTTATSTDARGITRDDAPDIGAYEENTMTTTTWNGTSWSNGEPDETKRMVINGDYTTSGNITANFLAITSGNSLTVNSGNTLSINKNVGNYGTLNIDGTFEFGGCWISGNTTGIVNLIGTNQTIAGSNTFGGFYKTASSTDILYFEATQTQNIENLTLKGNAPNFLSIKSTLDDTRFNINVSGSRTIDWLIVKDSYNTSSSILAPNSMNEGNNISWTFEAPAMTTWISPGTWDNGAPDDTKLAIISFPYNNGIDINCKSLKVNSGTNLEIQENSTLTASEDIINDGTITIKSSAMGEGSLIANGALSGSGSYNIERYLSSGQWHLVTSPITTGLSGVFNDIWLRPYVEADNTFGEYITPTTTALPTGQGFSVWANENGTRTFTGTPNHGTVGPLAAQLTGVAGPNSGWNLMGNPYPSSIDWDAASGWMKSGLNNTIYVWNNTQYATYVGGIGNNGGSRYIAPGQGFFVQANNPEAMLSMNNNVRVHNGVNFMKSTNNNDTENVIRIQINGNGYSDEAVIAIREANSEAFDPMSDAYKLTGSSDAPQMYISKDDMSKLSIASFNNIEDIENKSININYAQESEHNISWTHTLSGSLIPVLIDQITGQSIEAGVNYTYSASNSDQADRFIFSTDPLKIEDNQKEITIWENNNILYINTSETDNAKICIFNIHGVKIIESCEKILDLNHLTPGMYIVNIQSGNKNQTEKIIIK